MYSKCMHFASEAAAWIICALSDVSLRNYARALVYHTYLEIRGTLRYGNVTDKIQKIGRSDN